MDARGDWLAAITGDVARSTSLPDDDRRRLQQFLVSELPADLDALLPNVLIAGVDVYRGDGVQMLLREPRSALRACLFTRASLRSAPGLGGLDIRLAVGLGTVTTMPQRRVSDGDGEAYRNSGPLLDAMPRRRYLAIRTPDDHLSDAADVLFQLTDAVARRWTDRQAIAVCGRLRGMTQVEIARLAQWDEGATGIRQASVAAHLQAADWDAVERALRHFETGTNANIDSKTYTESV